MGLFESHITAYTRYFIHSSFDMGMWTASILWLLWRMQLWTCMFTHPYSCFYFFQIYTLSVSFSLLSWTLSKDWAHHSWHFSSCMADSIALRTVITESLHFLLSATVSSMKCTFDHLPFYMLPISLSNCLAAVTSQLFCFLFSAYFQQQSVSCE